MTSAQAAPNDDQAATVIDVAEKFRSLFVIGRGGMGSVEVALERAGSEFQRVVALKRLLPDAARDKRHIDMFLREARLAALLSHPNVVHAFDFGESRSGLYLAMEYVEGEPLSQVVRTAYAKEGRLAPALVAYILAEICDGLHAAHELRDVNGAPLNVVHRDVSPHNVMVSYEGHVKLLDFGVAKIEDDRGVTKTGEVKGKTAYMSPEQGGERHRRHQDGRQPAVDTRLAPIDQAERNGVADCAHGEQQQPLASDARPGPAASSHDERQHDGADPDPSGGNGDRRNRFDRQLNQQK